MTAPRTLGPSPEALRALTVDLEHVLGTYPGLTYIQLCRRLQLRSTVGWSVVAPLIESGRVVVRGEGLHVAGGGPTRSGGVVPSPAMFRP